MTNEANQSPDSPREDFSTPEDIPMVAIPPSVEQETNIMTLDELDQFREFYSFPPHMQLRIPEEGETITSTHPNKGPIQSEQQSQAKLRLAILQGEVQENLAQRILSNVKGRKRKFFFAYGEDWEFYEGLSREYGVLRVPKSWASQLGKGGRAILDPGASRVQVLLSLELKLVFLEFELKLGSYAMSKRISFKKLSQNVVKFNAEKPTTKSTSAKGVAADELIKVKGKRDAQSKEQVVEEFKSSSEYEVVVETASSKYFGEGFDFFKRQLRRHHPDMDINLIDMGFDHDILVEEDENKGDESRGEKDKDDGGEEQQ
ncbi:hypothetical protein Acr_00g0084390 [Actinidia rufa]|uniref:Uncharacterized protein n=1 Tax=Actinidia rufa TaxID=165716 RepID=A0A7J0DV63_9ERIC|nr:hypothetical protein Acr_00g0084390 [Actinidia rufa]